MTDEFMRKPPDHDPSLPFRLTADDLIGDLAWPQLLRAPRLAFRPGRVGIGVAVVLVLSLLDQVLARIAGEETVAATFFGAFDVSVASTAEGLASLDVGGALMATVVGLGGAIQSVWSEAPLRASVMLPVTVLGFAFASVGIGRLSAEEFCRGRSGTWYEGMKWAVHCVTGIAVAYLLPLVIAALLIGVLAIGGWALLSIPFVNVLGAVLGLVGLAIALVIVVVLLGYLFGVPLFAGGMSVEGRDGVDAMHRVYAYLFARPLRAAGYGLLLVIQGVVVVSVLGAIAGLTVSLGVWAQSLLLGEEASLVASGVSSDRLGAGGRAAASVMHTVLQLPALLVTGYVVAYAATGAVVLYLVLRRIVDGQDMVDLYVPGEIDAKLDEVLARRKASIEQNEDLPA
ncbi:MAG: hypothetical protein AAFS11_03470 [Planctomycetota bacterium]